MNYKELEKENKTKENSTIEQQEKNNLPPLKQLERQLTNISNVNNFFNTKKDLINKIN